MLLGVILAVLSALSFNAAFIIEKQALHRMPSVHAGRTGHMAKTLLTSPQWMMGFCMSLLGVGLQVLALSKAPLSVVQPIIASGIVVVLMLSHFVLHERLGRQEWTGIAIVVAGLMMVGLTLDRDDKIGTAGSAPRILLASIPTVLVAAACFYAANRRGKDGAPYFGLAAGLLYGVGGLAVKGVSVIVDRYHLIKAIPHAILSPDLYLIGVFAGAGLLVFQTGLQRGKAAVIVPISNVLSAVYPVGVGMALFGEQFPHQTWRLAIRLLGFGGVLAGSVVLASGRSLAHVYEEEAEDIHQLEVGATAVRT